MGVWTLNESTNATNTTSHRIGDLVFEIQEVLGDLGFTLNNRELATLAWAGVLAIVVLRDAHARRSVRSFLSHFKEPKIAGPFPLYAGWVGLLVWVGELIYLWRLSFTKATIVWGLTSGFWGVLNLEAAKKPGYVKENVRKALGITALLAYFVSLSSLHILVELILQPLVLVVQSHRFCPRPRSKGRL